MTRPRQVGILHPGEMGISIAASAQNSGCEAVWASEGRSAATRKRAARYGLRDAGTVERLGRECPIVFSVCPPHAAEDLARQVLDSGFRGVYVDANAIAPERSIAIGRLVEADGARYVDGGIVGEPAWEPGTTWLHLAGPAAAEAAACFSAGPLQTRDLGPEIGRASALKMCFAANTKGTTALLAAILGTAERLGVRKALEEQWDARHSGLSAQVSDRVRNVARKAWRFEGEMNEISATFRAAGMPGEFHAAASEVYRRLTSYKDVEEPPELDSVIDALLRRADPEPASPDGSEDGDTMFTIRPAALEDVPTLLVLIRGLADYENLTDMVAATEDGLRKTLFGPRSAAEALVAFAGDEAAGMAIHFPTYSTFLARPGLYLEDLFVTPKWRGRGLGERLLRRVAKIALERDCGRLEWAVLDWNELAIDFYRRRGARMLAEWKLCRVTGGALRKLAGTYP